jgi:hypothetical protein
MIFQKWSICFRRPARWCEKYKDVFESSLSVLSDLPVGAKYKDVFESSLIVPNNLSVGEKYKDFLEVV